VITKMATACTIEDMYKNFQILADAKEKAGEVIVERAVTEAACRALTKR